MPGDARRVGGATAIAVGGANALDLAQPGGDGTAARPALPTLLLGTSGNGPESECGGIDVRHTGIRDHSSGWRPRPPPFKRSSVSCPEGGCRSPRRERGVPAVGVSGEDPASGTGWGGGKGIEVETAWGALEGLSADGDVLQSYAVLRTRTPIAGCPRVTSCHALTRWLVCTTGPGVYVRESGSGSLEGRLGGRWSQGIVRWVESAADGRAA